MLMYLAKVLSYKCLLQLNSHLLPSSTSAISNVIVHSSIRIFFRSRLIHILSFELRTEAPLKFVDKTRKKLKRKKDKTLR